MSEEMVLSRCSVSAPCFLCVCSQPPAAMSSRPSTTSFMKWRATLAPRLLFFLQGRVGAKAAPLRRQVIAAAAVGARR